MGVNRAYCLLFFVSPSCQTIEISVYAPCSVYDILKKLSLLDVKFVLGCERRDF